jgi:putative tricarboxylic transport membrane protein
MLTEIFLLVFQPEILLLIIAGVIIGNIFGCIPGLNAPIAIALALPITFVLDSFQSMALIMGLYMGCVAGGLVSAILLKIPGTAANVATTFDGYPMAMKGKATDALSFGSFASLVGGIISSLFLLLLAPLLANIALQFGPWEYFGTGLLALILVCSLMGNKMLKGLIAVCIGLLFTCVGLSPVDGIALRYTFGSTAIESGFNLIVVIIGVFAIPEIINASGKMDESVQHTTVEKRKFYVPSFATIKRNMKVMISGSFLGTFIGILPGMGGGAASLISYEQAKKTSKHPELYGTGYEEGIFCCESANNATTGGALIPMLALGVPGDTASAVIMGALMLQGITPGPLLSMNNPVLFRSIILIVFVANIFMWLFQASTIRFMAKIAIVPKYILFPIVTMFCVAGTISIRNNPFDLAYLMAFGIIGYILDKNDYPLAPFILSFILGSFIEGNLRRAITYYGSFKQCLVQPSIGTLFFILACILPILSFYLRKRNKNKA